LMLAVVLAVTPPYPLAVKVHTPVPTAFVAIVVLPETASPDPPPTAGAEQLTETALAFDVDQESVLDCVT